MGIFGNLFDFNNDGKLDSFEKAAEFGAFMQMIDSAKNDELTSAGLDPQELSDMGYFERREAIEDAGLDPEITIYKDLNLADEHPSSAIAVQKIKRKMLQSQDFC